MYLEDQRRAHVAKRASFYLRVNYRDGSDDIFRVLGQHGKMLAAKYEKIVKKHPHEAKASRLGWAELQALLAEKRHSLRLQPLD